MILWAILLYLTKKILSPMRRSLLIVLLGFLLAFPLVYLMVRSSSAPPLKEEVPVVQTPTNDLATLEKLVAADSSFEHLINLSQAYINGQMPGKSIPLLKKAIILQPNSAAAYNNLGVAYTLLQQFSDGVTACTKAVQLDPKFQLAQNNLQWAQGEKQKVMEDIANLEKQNKEPFSDAYYLNLGFNYFKIGNYEKSIELWNELVVRDPKNTQALNNIGTAFMMKGQVEDAQSIFMQLVKDHPEDQLAKNNLQWALDELSRSIKK